MGQLKAIPVSISSNKTMADISVIRMIIGLVNTEHLKAIPTSISIFQYLIFICFLRFVGIVIGMYIIFWISIKLKSYIVVILASVGVLILPIIFALLRIEIFEWFLINPFLIGNMF